MITYSMQFAVRSNSREGHGKLAWRSWAMQRRFDHGELPRLPVVGSVLFMSGLQHMRCTTGLDSFGDYNSAGIWDASLPVTEFDFELASPRGWVGRLGCYHNLISPARLIVSIEEAGFSVKIGPPCAIQEPTETRPPKVPE
jgi:hypothetical protein